MEKGVVCEEVKFMFDCPYLNPSGIEGFVYRQVARLLSQPRWQGRIGGEGTHGTSLVLQEMVSRCWGFMGGPKALHSFHALFFQTQEGEEGGISSFPLCHSNVCRSVPKNIFHWRLSSDVQEALASDIRHHNDLSYLIIMIYQRLKAVPCTNRAEWNKDIKNQSHVRIFPVAAGVKILAGDVSTVKTSSLKDTGPSFETA